MEERGSLDFPTENILTVNSTTDVIKLPVTLRIITDSIHWFNGMKISSTLITESNKRS